MFLFTIIAKPSPENTEHNGAGGAYVNAWIDFKEQEAAEAIARFYIEDSDWIPGEIDEVSWVTDSDYEPDDEDYQYYMEAKEHGSSLVFHNWPADAEDAQTKH